MPRKSPPDELRNWSLAKEQIGEQLKKHYRACTTEELPPRLLALVEKLDEKVQPSADQPEIIRDIEN